MLKIALGHSDDVDSLDAIEEVLARCHAELDGAKPQAALLYTGIDFEHEVIVKAIHHAYPGILLLGCTGNAEISSKMGLQEDSVTLACIHSDQIKFALGLGEGLGGDVKGATEQAVAQAKSQLEGEPKLCFTLYESLTVSGMAVVDGLQQALGPEVPITGGSSAYQWQMKRTYQFIGDQIYSDAVGLLLLSGPVALSYGVDDGWNTMGERQSIQIGEPNRLLKIGDLSAGDFYKKYLGSLEKVTGEFPLAVFEKDRKCGGEDSKDYYLRSPLFYHDDGSITFGGDLPEGAEVQLTRAKRDEILGATRNAYDQAMSRFTGQSPKLVLVTSCAGRKLVLGTRTKEEINSLTELFGPDVPIIGYYGNGEVCPLQGESKACYHNETIVILILGEA